MNNEKFIESIEKNIQIINNEFEKGNWTELYFQASLIEVTLKYILILELKEREKYDSDIERYIDNLGLFNLIKNCFVLGIIGKEIHKKLEKYRKYRNNLVHKMFLSLKNLEELNIKEMNNLGKEIITNLISIIKIL